MIAKASIDEPRPVDDKTVLQEYLFSCINRFSRPNLSMDEVIRELDGFPIRVHSITGNTPPFSWDIKWTLSTGTSQKEFNEWKSRGLGSALEKQVESILGKDWEYS
jgi:hypothetical protein